MSETVELRLYSPLQVDIIDRGHSDQPIPLQAVSGERKEEYLRRIARALGELQPQEDARHAFSAPQQDWSEISKKIISVVRAVTLVNNKLYGLYLCRSRNELAPKEVENLKRYCRDQWERGWGEGYAHCPREGASPGLYIHFWQDTTAPLLTRDELAAFRTVEQKHSAVTEITPDTFWALITQAKNSFGENQDEAVYWLTDQLLALGPEQALKFDNLFHGYSSLADKYGLWSAASIMLDGCSDDSFMDFRSWLIYQGKETYLAALKNPDSLADIPLLGDGHFESLAYIGDSAYEKLTHRHAYQDIDQRAYEALKSELVRDISYGSGIGYPYKWKDLASYLPRLCARYVQPQALAELVRTNAEMWNTTCPDVQAARKTEAKSDRTQKRSAKKAKRGREETR